MFNISLVPNWKQLLGKSITHWLVYLGIGAEVILKFADMGDLPVWAFVALLGAIGVGRIVQQGLSDKPDTGNDEVDYGAAK
jgi:hypothetical protein